MACEAQWQLALDEVRLVPARTPPHKLGREIAPPETRAEWVEAAVQGRPGLTVSRIELEREGPSYTADTLEAMAAAEPGVAASGSCWAPTSSRASRRGATRTASWPPRASPWSPGRAWTTAS